MAPDGTESRRPGVLLPHGKDRGTVEMGDCRPDGNLGLPVPAENVAEVGVVMPLGD